MKKSVKYVLLLLICLLVMCSCQDNADSKSQFEDKFEAGKQSGSSLGTMNSSNSSEDNTNSNKNSNTSQKEETSVDPFENNYSNVGNHPNNLLRNYFSAAFDANWIYYVSDSDIRKVDYNGHNDTIAYDGIDRHDNYPENLNVINGNLYFNYNNYVYTDNERHRYIYHETIAKIDLATGEYSEIFVTDDDYGSLGIENVIVCGNYLFFTYLDGNAEYPVETRYIDLSNNTCHTIAQYCVDKSGEWSGEVFYNFDKDNLYIHAYLPSKNTYVKYNYVIPYSFNELTSITSPLIVRNDELPDRVIDITPDLIYVESGTKKQYHNSDIVLTSTGILLINGNADASLSAFKFISYKDLTAKKSPQTDNYKLPSWKFIDSTWCLYLLGNNLLTEGDGYFIYSSCNGNEATKLYEFHSSSVDNGGIYGDTFYYIDVNHYYEEDKSDKLIKITSNGDWTVTNFSD